MGKTSLIKRFVTEEFTDHRNSTKVAAMLAKVVETMNSTYKLMIWDTMGQEKYNALTPMYYRGRRWLLDADIVVFVFDKGDQKSFSRVKELVNSVMNECAKNPCSILSRLVMCVAMNKNDLDECAVDEGVVREYVKVCVYDDRSTV